MNDLKPCPFCGNKEVILSDYRLVGNSTCWRITCLHCRLVMSGANKQLLLNLWNTRPAEEALKAEVEELSGYVKHFRETLAEVAQMANNSDQAQIFEKCRDALRDVYLEEKFRDAFDKILHNPDTEKGEEDD